MNKLLTAISAVLLVISLCHCSWHENEAQYFQISCSVIDRAGNLIYYSPDQQYCAFASSGKSVVSDGETLRYLDQEQGLIWKLDLNVHHDLKMIDNESHILMITRQSIDFENELAMADCFETRDLRGELLHQWCMKDHISELKNLGFKLKKKHFAEARIYKGKKTDIELSHANSVYQIPDNSHAAQNSAFQKGNFLAHLHVPTGALLVLDAHLEKILWSMNLSLHEELLYSHDLQVTPDGDILGYLNKVPLNEILMCNYTNDLLASLLPEPVSQETEFTWYTAVAEIDPENLSIKKIVRPSPFPFVRSAIVGSVTKLQNGNYIFSDITHGGRAVEVDSKGNQLWEWINPQKDLSGRPISIRSVKVFENMDFLRSHGITPNH